MRQKILFTTVNIVLACIWLANGLFCKILNLVPRHQQIVARILGSAHEPLLTKLIGISEIVMAVWIISGFKRKWNVVTQVTVIGVMNAIEFFYANDLLLWGHWNAFFAAVLMVVIVLNYWKFSGGGEKQ